MGKVLAKIITHISQVRIGPELVIILAINFLAIYLVVNLMLFFLHQDQFVKLHLNRVQTGAQMSHFENLKIRNPILEDSFF